MSGKPAPPKPWERAGNTGVSTTTPLGPSTASDGAPKPWENPAGTALTSTPSSTIARARPWEASGTSSYGNGTLTGYGSGSYGVGGYGAGTYGTGSYGSGMYGSGGYGMGGYGGYNSTLGSNYGGYSSYGSTPYGSMYNRPGMYGGSMYGGGYGGSMYGGMYGARSPYGAGTGPFDGQNPPPEPPSSWQSMLHALGGVVHFFGRLSFLVDENAHAVHFFISALLQLLDRVGTLYGEMARFVLRLLGYKEPKPKEPPPGMPAGPPGAPPRLAWPATTLGPFSSIRSARGFSRDKWV
eukprot:jgi/Botrbrau1/14912/Bobra.0018s0016.1